VSLLIDHQSQFAGISLLCRDTNGFSLTSKLPFFALVSQVGLAACKLP
jgi:hypothetical protein